MVPGSIGRIIIPLLTARVRSKPAKSWVATLRRGGSSGHHAPIQQSTIEVELLSKRLWNNGLRGGLEELSLLEFHGSKSDIENGRGLICYLWCYGVVVSKVMFNINVIHIPRIL